MKYLFLDTNIYLHYQWFEDIDWKSVCELSDDFTIVVPPVVIREIDKQKDSGRDRVKTRAKQVSSKFGEIFVKDQQSKKVKVIDCNEASTDLFKGTGLNLNIQDDWVIATVLQFYCDSADKLIVSADINLLMKAKYNHIPFCKINEALKLDDTFEANRKQISEGIRSSKLVLSFDGNKDHIEFNSVRYDNYNNHIEKIINSFVGCNNKIINLKNLGAYLTYLWDKLPDSYSALLLYCVGSSLCNTLGEDKGSNNSVEECIENAMRVFSNEYKSENMRELHFVLSNEGKAPTNNYEVKLMFPDDIDLFYKNETNQISSFLDGRYSKRQKRVFDFKNSDILNHTQSIELKEEPGIFICASECKNFKIEYEIYDFSLAEPRKSGVLNVVVK